MMLDQERDLEHQQETALPHHVGDSHLSASILECIILLSKMINDIDHQILLCIIALICISIQYAFGILLLASSMYYEVNVHLCAKSFR
jgi:hypothetical protein